VPAASVAEVVSQVWNSGPIQEAITTLQHSRDKHPFVIALLLNGVLPRFVKLAVLEKVIVAAYRRDRNARETAESRQAEELSAEITEIFTYLLPTSKGPRRRKYTTDEINDLLLRAITEAGMEPLAAHGAVKRNSKGRLPPGRPPIARHSALLALELQYNEKGITMRQIADRVCHCGNKQHKPRCECLRTLRKEIHGLKEFMTRLHLK